MGIALEKRIIPVTDERNNTQVLFMMAAALEERDRYTHAHAQRVAAYSRRLATRLGLSGEMLINITLGGMLHDVGKLALSDRIFSNAQAACSKDMRGEVLSHPLIGASLLRQISCSKTIIETVLYHHERIDGSGYPFGLEGDGIPLSAQIVSIADCFDAMTTDRPYQRRKSLTHTYFIMKGMAGKSLDKELVSLMMTEIQAEGLESVMPGSDTSPAASQRYSG